MSYEVQIEDRPAQPVLAIRTRTSAEQLPLFLGQAYGAIAGYLAELGEQPAGPPFVIYRNLDMNDLDVEAGFAVARLLPGKGTVSAEVLPQGQVVTTLHVGPYVELATAYSAVTEWMKANRCEPTGVVYEYYLNDPTGTLPQELRTQIVFPLKEE